MCHFGLSIRRAVLTSHSRCAKDSASWDTKFCPHHEHRKSGVEGRVVEEFCSCCKGVVEEFHRTLGVGGHVVQEFRNCSERAVEEFRICYCFLGKLFLNVVEEFRSCLSKPEGRVCHF